MREIVAVRWLFLGIVLATTATAVTWLWSTLRVDGLTPAKDVFLVLFAVLFAWISASFWIAFIGVFARRRRGGDLLIRPDGPSELSTSRTAIVMPVFHEDPEAVCANARAIAHSLIAAGGAARFDIYVLSDSSDRALRRAEEAAFAQLRESMLAGVKFYYRNRASREGRKSGNIADFCRNWGALYDYMVVLDADSLMSGETLVALARLMDANPRAALIQVPPLLIGRESLFARLQQFSSAVYGPLHAAGLGYLLGPDGNYWGHNAIIRIVPFMQNCGLPDLPGRAPLGGEILSHDFIEAALLMRAGWQVHLAADLGGSYEEPPPTMLDHLKRDRRWCQGNLQHLRLIFAQGFPFPSRLHLVSGVMSYLSQVLWLVMLFASARVAYDEAQVPEVIYLGRYPLLTWPVSHVVDTALLIAATVLMLFGQKLLALFVLLRDPKARAAHGGAVKLSLSIVLESLFSILYAPIAMLSHCWFVLSISSGFSIEWARQRRREHLPEWESVLWAFLPHTLAAVVAAWALMHWTPDTAWWFVPLLLGAVLSIPLCALTSSVRAGRALRRLCLLLVPSETNSPIACHPGQATQKACHPGRAVVHVVHDPR